VCEFCVCVGLVCMCVECVVCVRGGAEYCFRRNFVFSCLYVRGI